MIIEQRIYTLHPGKVPEYMRLYEAEGLTAQEPILGKLVGWYAVDFGPQNQIIHMWAYDSYEERARRRAELGKSAAWQAFLPKILPLILRQENKTLIPAPWSPKP
ncbi:MAG: NIPSNAP family protein [Proteobacteria bacterium]|nr:NIPSNAP family protein [Pseudomonadota bacterium]